jgi:demethylmenaquinone methyltransferase/2-methoxy-6-polyprenyl-1,4-benzoquinol methylase
MFRDMAQGSDRGQTHFGFRTVERAEKAGMVRQVFDSVAERYDLMNDLMSGGVHRLWKRALVERLNPRPPLHVLDLAGGTGDVGLRVLARAGGAKTGARVTICDVNPKMLAVGRDRALDQTLIEGVDWLCADAEALSFADTSFDAVTVAFGLRNVTDLERALGEVRRVLKPGGRFLCLEFSHVTEPALERLYEAYSFNVLPALGEVVTGDGDAYRYLVESIRRFPDQAAFAAMIAAADLGNVKVRNFSGGIAALHSAWRL